MREDKKVPTIRVREYIIGMEDASVIDEGVVVVRIENYGAGELVVVSEPNCFEEQKGVHIEEANWPAIKEAIDKLLKECRE